MRNVETLSERRGIPFPVEGARVSLWQLIAKEVASLSGWHHHQGRSMTLKECEEELPRIRLEMREMRERLDELERGRDRDDDVGAPPNG